MAAEDLSYMMSGGTGHDPEMDKLVQDDIWHAARRGDAQSIEYVLLVVVSRIFGPVCFDSTLATTAHG